MQKVRRKTATGLRRVGKRVPRVVGDDPILTEHEEQCLVVQWFRRTYAGVRIFAVPNGSQRSKTTGARLKAEGVSAGVPDLYVPEWALWAEMKRADGGAVSASQRDWHDYLRGIGHTVIVCRGFLHAKEEIEALAKKR